MQKQIEGPRIIAIEGIDGAGKSLQFKMLKEKLDSLGKSSLELSFPVYESFIGKEIGAMLSGKNSVRADIVDAKSMALWYAIDRLAAFSRLDINEYDYLLLNRYTLSNAVYQGLRVENSDKTEFAKWVFKLEHEELHLPKPSTYIILDIDEKTSAENIGKKGYREYTGNMPDVYEKKEDLIKNARDLYLEFAKELENIKIINCMCGIEMLSPKDIHARILETLKLY